MAKISELNEDELVKYIAQYEKKVKAGGENVTQYQKKLMQLKQALEKFEDDENDGEVKSYHSHDVDYTGYEDATVQSRAVALFLDGILVGITTQILIVIVKIASEAMMAQNAKIITGLATIILQISLPTIYALYFLRKDGQTLGKKLMKIKVIYEDSNEQLSYGTIIIRETIGKMISSIVFMLGFIVRFFGYRTWHDKMANTRVISVK